MGGLAVCRHGRRDPAPGSNANSTPQFSAVAILSRPSVGRDWKQHWVFETNSTLGDKTISWQDASTFARGIVLALLSCGAWPLAYSIKSLDKQSLKQKTDTPLWTAILLGSFWLYPNSISNFLALTLDMLTKHESPLTRLCLQKFF